MNKLDIEKMRSARHLLNPPAPEVVGQCLDEIERLRAWSAKLEGLSDAQHKAIGAQGQEIKRLRARIEHLEGVLTYIAEENCGLVNRSVFRQEKEPHKG